MFSRGQGGSSEDKGGVKGNTLGGHIIRGLDDKPEKMLFRQIFLDTAQMARIVMDMPDVDAKRVGATGASQGGGDTEAQPGARGDQHQTEAAGEQSPKGALRV